MAALFSIPKAPKMPTITIPTTPPPAKPDPALLAAVSAESEGIGGSLAPKPITAADENKTMLKPKRRLVGVA